MRAFRNEQYGQFQGAINKFLDGYHQGKVPLEEFARMAEDTFSGLRTNFNQRMASGADAAGKQLMAKPISDIETAEALKAGRYGNLNRVRAWSERAYGKIRGQHGNADIDLLPFHSKAEELLSPIPVEEYGSIFPPSSMKLLKTAAQKKAVPMPDVAEKVAMESFGVPYAGLDQMSQQRVLETAGKVIAEAPQQSKSISLSEAMKVRSELLRRVRDLPSDKKEYKRYLLELSDSLNDSMERSLANTAGKEKAFKQLQSLNREYKGYMESLTPPRSPGKPGNIAAKALESADIPENLPGKLTSSETMARKTMEAVDPATAKLTGEPSSNAIDPKQALRRNRFDEMRERATLRDPATGQSRLSPTAFSEELPDEGVRDAIYGGQNPDVSGLGKPKLVDRERILFQSPLANAVDKGSSKAVFDSAFPKRGFNGRIEDTMSVFNEAGRVPQAQRAYAEGILEQAEQRIPSISDTKVTGPRKFETVIDKYGETTEKVLGPDGVATFKDFEDLGKGMTEAEALRGNAPGTAQMVQNIGIGKRLLDPREWPSLAKEGAIVAAAGNRFTNPKKFNWMFEKPEKLIGTVDYPKSGLAGQVASHLPFDVPPPSREDDSGLQTAREEADLAVARQEAESNAVPGILPNPLPPPDDWIPNQATKDVTAKTPTNRPANAPTLPSVEELEFPNRPKFPKSRR
jgi:hypothetical protein